MTPTSCGQQRTPTGAPSPSSYAAGTNMAKAERFASVALYVTCRGAGLFISKGCPRWRNCSARSSSVSAARAARRPSLIQIVEEFDV